MSEHPVVSRILADARNDRRGQLRGESKDKGNPEINSPPPHTYLLPLILGLLLYSRVQTSFLPRSVARGLRWPLLGVGVLLARWFRQTMRVAGGPVRAARPALRPTTAGPFGYGRNPAYLALVIINAGIAVLRNSLWTIIPLPWHVT